MLIRLSVRFFLVPLVAALIALLGSDRQATASAVFSDGHGDIGVAYDDIGKTFDLHVHVHAGSVVDGSPLVSDAEYAPDEIVILVTTETARPVGAQFDFTGTGAGQPLWRLFQTLVPGTPFLGLASEELDSADWVGGELTWEVTSIVSGPAGGEFSLWQNEIGGPVVLASSFDGLPGSFNLLAGGHAHANYGFTALGIYEIELTVTGEHIVDGVISSSAIYTFNVVAVPEPGSLTLAGIALGGIVFVASRRRTRGH